MKADFFCPRISTDYYYPIKFKRFFASLRYAQNDVDMKLKEEEDKALRLCRKALSSHSPYIKIIVILSEAKNPPPYKCCIQILLKGHGMSYPFFIPIVTVFKSNKRY